MSDTTLVAFKKRATLAAIFRICALKGWDNWTYTHISQRVDQDTFLMNPFHVLYKDVTPENLIAVDMRKPPEVFFDAANPTGVYLHSAIYKNRPDVESIFHLHTTHGVAVSSLECGLIPLSQFALHFYNAISFHPYDSLVLDEKEQCNKLAQDLGSHYAMFLENHGTITVGRSLEEAFFFTHHLEEACKVQCLAMSCHTNLIIPSSKICEKAYDDLMSFEPERGKRDFNAALGLLDPHLRKEWDL